MIIAVDNHADPVCTGIIPFLKIGVSCKGSIGYLIYACCVVYIFDFRIHRKTVLLDSGAGGGVVDNNIRGIESLLDIKVNQ